MLNTMTTEHHEPCADGETVIDSEGDWRDAETKQIVQRIEVLRQSIDNIDMAIVALLAERFKATTQVGVLKAEAGFAPADYTREASVAESTTSSVTGIGIAAIPSTIRCARSRCASSASSVNGVK